MRSKPPGRDKSSPSLSFCLPLILPAPSITLVSCFNPPISSSCDRSIIWVIWSCCSPIFSHSLRSPCPGLCLLSCRPNLISRGESIEEITETYYPPSSICLSLSLTQTSPPASVDKHDYCADVITVESTIISGSIMHAGLCRCWCSKMEHFVPGWM